MPLQFISNPFDSTLRNKSFYWIGGFKVISEEVFILLGSDKLVSGLDIINGFSLKTLTGKYIFNKI